MRKSERVTINHENEIISMDKLKQEFRLQYFSMTCIKQQKIYKIRPSLSF